MVLSVLKPVLRYLARLTIRRYRPAIVGVTGSVGKTSAKLAIAAVLGSERFARAAKGNFNGAIGLPLAILGDWSGADLRLISIDTPPGKYPLRKAWFFLKVICTSLWRLAVRRPYPEILVLEYGIDRPGDMKELLNIARPNVGVITAIGETPAHVEFFKGPEEVAREKSKLVESIPSTGYVVLNADDERVIGTRPRIRGQLLTFGFSKDALIQIANFENRSDGARPLGAGFKLQYGGSSVPVRLEGAFGRSNAYASGIAAAVGLIFGMNLVKISSALTAYYRPAPHRMELVPGVKGIWVIDDSYNAGALSMRSALEALQELPGKRKVAILGDMLEIGGYAAAEHEKVGRLAAKAADVLVTVGERGKLIADGARKGGLPRKSVLEFESVEDARSPVQTLVQHGDLVLVKASHGIHLEKIVAEIRAFGEAEQESRI